ncbi:MAG: hypothetical protein A3C93_01690 [Candidatus Lloydbacteria bacterium RIFCSPHIGHO2_02_FULL_54_17]|uniref:Uncharacterized protein n=1 Tax=Candidatus Lloydbacteria bacterium RIFCSPHIGHO2_02_FULL_54_17 TaxID=1798664 RepID=A0A1G2DBR5_9BACT|nr:MAG: hypothetical protein A2762_02870 [Candidatus Lloydbacteria bacterium RIFCSPHIGHO2_01_FULL_54_11]OGZ11065.1 MAG: hypothetical protein A3C93_01690 [Candidatus Lloydbacteria bacterium RIFCSPHIGHO2_02_FULL_54_17]OGZ14464.1 MAG: hypothetical protein A3H76_06205 [Candidatus Lloydbacteria bacterium RIFCSPLOWO2_02_FULL_54_12]OGZ15480.1 MAG: hypothetical protein A2948_02810 [Candidatus Lloydbacteria bacterium RIFCSPLOWO2_01_FULL_54_18]
MSIARLTILLAGTLFLIACSESKYPANEGGNELSVPKTEQGKKIVALEHAVLGNRVACVADDTANCRELSAVLTHKALIRLVPQ